MVMLDASVVTVTLAPATMDKVPDMPWIVATRLPDTSAVLSVTAPVLPATDVTGGDSYPLMSAVLSVTAPVRPETLDTAGAVYPPMSAVVSVTTPVRPATDATGGD